MAKSTTVITQKRRGPAPTGKGILIGVRIQPEMLAALDKFVSEQDRIGRPEAIRLILKDWLTSNGILKKEGT
jgi:metal-responsive CopG/Arc/MetJ family transcriptional regulator